MSTRTSTSTYYSFGSSIIPPSHYIDNIRLAILAGNLPEVKELSKKVSLHDITANRDIYGNTLLHTAILLGRPEIAEFLLINFGCPLTTANSRGETCYDLLAKSNLGSLVKYIHDSEKKKVETSQIETRSKSVKIVALETEVRSLENANVRLSKENQELTIKLGKRDREIDELETQKSNLIKASKKK
jgi:ankyrin repeat protein